MGNDLIGPLKPATRISGKKLVEHLFHPWKVFEEGEIKIVCESVLPGGYESGSRIYAGTQHGREVFRVSVVDSGEGAFLLREWLKKKGIFSRVEYKNLRTSFQPVLPGGRVALPLPGEEDIALLRYAIMISRRLEAGEGVRTLATELQLTKGQVEILRSKGDRYLNAPAFIQRFKESGQRTTRVLRILEDYMGVAPWEQPDAAALVAQVKARFQEWWREHSSLEPELDAESAYRKYRTKWCLKIRGLGEGGMKLLFAWLDECESGLRAPVALENFPPGSIAPKPPAYIYRR